MTHELLLLTRIFTTHLLPRAARRVAHHERAAAVTEARVWFGVSRGDFLTELLRELLKTVNKWAMALYT